MMKRRGIGALLATTMLLTAASVGQEKEITIGMAIGAVPDPHYFWSSSYLQYYKNYFGFLTDMNTDGQVVPSLAESYEPVEDGWVFHLVPGVKFTDDTDFEAADVVASYERARDYEGAAGSYAGLFANIVSMTAVDPVTVKFTTNGPYPTLPFALTQVPIISSEVAETATQSDFDTAAVNVGLGPYRFVSMTPGQQLVLEKNPNFWGEEPEWDRVTFRFMPDNSSRVAALLAGDVDVIDRVPPEFTDRIKSDDALALYVGPSMRGVFLALDQDRDNSAFITDNAGQPMSENPLKDRRVREAMSLAIDREAIQTRVMGGLSFSTGQLVAPGTGGYSENIDVPPYDPTRATELLQDAGYPDGFQLTLHCTNDRYVNDAKICQALGAMFARIGIKTNVMPLPSSAFFSVVMPGTGEGLSAGLISWASGSSGEADVLANVIHSFDAESKLGSWNLGRYSNAEVDALIEQANQTADAAERHALMAEAMRMSMEDFAAIPLHDQAVVVATRKGLAYTISPDELTQATLVSEE